MKLNESLGLRKTLAFKVQGVNRRYIFLMSDVDNIVEELIIKVNWQVLSDKGYIFEVHQEQFFFLS